MPLRRDFFGGGRSGIDRDRTRCRVAAVEFTCPRCQSPTETEFYGPCAGCRTELVNAYRSDGRVVELAEYEPKMNVTPNAVALKDD